MFILVALILPRGIPERLFMKVRDIMTKEVKCCGPDTNLAAATELMWSTDCGILPVMDNGKLVGIVTDRDICIALGTQNRRATEVRAGEIASHDVQTCAVDADVDSAMAAMRRAKIHRLPVVDDGKMVGILALNDIVDAVDVRSDIDTGVVMDTLKAVGEHRHPRSAKGSVAPTTWPPISVAVA
jgi:CBS domain-containing protein